MNDVFKQYPKKRIELPKAYQDIYTKHYLANRLGETAATSVSKKLESWMHKKVAADRGETQLETATLEIGAGTLNQLDYERSAIYDIIEPFEDLYKNSKNLSAVRNRYSDISRIKTSDKYDRIISIATFEHITDLPKVVALSCMLLNEQGTLRFAIPNEGTWLWKLAYKLTTGIEFRLKYGLKYDTLMQYEHVNTASEIEEVVKCFYKNVKSSVFGINKYTALYRFYECSNPYIEKAKTYLDITE